MDDVTLVASGKTKESLQTALQDSYLDMERVLNDHRMVINGGKTQLMITSTRAIMKSITILAGDQVIEHQDKLKIFGMTLTFNLKFDEHLKEDKISLTKSIYKKISILKNVKPYVSVSTLASIEKSLIGTTILSGAPVWSQTTAGNKAAVQKAQTKAARVVSGKLSWGYGEGRSHRQDILSDLGWNNVNQLT